MDRRIRRTRTALIDAVVAIVQESGWTEATVSAICARADVGRTTFYEHFDDRDDLLRACLDEVVQSFRTSEAGPLDIAAMTAHVFEGAVYLRNFFEIPQFGSAVIGAMADSADESTSETAARFAAAGLLAVAEDAARGGRPSQLETTELVEAALAIGGKPRRAR